MQHRVSPNVLIFKLPATVKTGQFALHAPLYISGETSGALGLRSGGELDSPTWDLRSAAFSTSTAASWGSEVVLANLRSVVA